MPSKWFSIPVVGITEFDAAYDGISAKYKGTIAYKNKLSFKILDFDFFCQYQGTAGKAVLFQFNKERRDSSIDDHHLQGMEKYNRGYGVLFGSDGSVVIEKTSGQNQLNELLNLCQKYDLSHPIHVRITQHKQEDKIEIGLEINRSGKIFNVSDKLEKGFSDEGYIGLTIYSGRSTVSLKNINYEGKECDTDLNESPRPLYMADYFEQSNRRLVHWRYDEGTTDFDKVLINSSDGRLLDTLRYPQDYWVIPADYTSETLLLYAINIDGDISSPVTVRLKDNHADYYAKQSPERITVRKGDGFASFYEKDSKEVFFVKGMNYVRLRYGDHCTFEADTKVGPACYDPYDAETLFKLMKKYGYNTVRVFISGRKIDNPGVSGYYENEGVYNSYVDNFIDFVRRARKYGLYVFPTFCDGELPRNKFYWDMIKDAKEGLVIDDVTIRTHNAVYVTVQGHNARSRYLKDFLGYIKSKDALLLKSLLAVQCQNELSMNGLQWPFDIMEGSFNGPDGKAYDMNNNDERQLLFENSLNKYHAQMVKAIKEVDSELLIGEGIFVPRIVGKDYDGDNYGIRNISESENRCPPKALMVLNSPLNFVDIHIYHVDKRYPLVDSYKDDMESTGLYSSKMKELLKTKPFIMGEFGSFKFMDSTFDKAKESILKTRSLALKDNAQGYMMWTFDTFEQRSIWHAMENEDFLKDLSR